MADLPTWDQAMTGPPAPRLPSWDEVMNPTPPGSSPENDSWLATSRLGRVLDAFGQGAKQGWGSEPLGLSDEASDFLTKAGIFNDYKEGQTSAIKAINEALIRPAAAGLEAILRGGTAAFGAYQTGVARIGTETGQPELGRDIAAMPEAFFGMPGALRRPSFTPAPDLPAARSLGVIGEGEAGYFGTKEPAPASVAERAAALKEQIQTEDAAKKASGAPEEPADTTGTIEVGTPPEAPPDIHAIAREIAPDTFAKYDALAAQTDTFRQWINELDQRRRTEAEANAPNQAEIAELQDRLEDASPKNAKKLKARIGQLTDERDRFLEQATEGDSEDMARVRRSLQETDYAMRDLAPQVSAAYREAQARMPALETPTAALATPAPGAQPAQAPDVSRETIEKPQETAPQRQIVPVSGALAVNPADVKDATLISQALEVQKAIGTPQIDRTHDVPYGAGSSDAGGKTYIDRRIPQEVEVKREDGTTGTLDPAKYLNIHEQVEHYAMTRLGKPYAKAHYDFATRAERAAVEADGFDWPSYEGVMDDLLKKTENEKPEKPPADLYKKPYPHTEAELLARRGQEPVAPATQLRPAETAPAIAQDVAQKLVAAGRPQDEANVAAALVAAHYEARAARFDGTKGTAEELYRAEAPDIQAGAVGGRQGAAAGKTVIKDARTVITLFKKADASTFIHETGHQWLEELMRDADEDNAPPDLIADGQVVRNWLKADVQGEITTRQHEKFARGFERYMMEGRAPSQALAFVFAKFKEWLTAIYRTVQKLRSPITDDIRDVFDRLLVPEAKRGTVAPEREVRNLADQHEELAETTPADRASETADRIRDEAAVAAKQKIPEIHDEVSPGRAGGYIPGEAAGAEPDRGGAAGQPEPGAAGGGAGLGAVEPGGGQTAGEGAGTDTATATKAGAAGGQPSQRGRNAAGGSAKPPAGPNALFDKPESPLFDKAGNIRLDNLNAPDDVDEVIREAAQQSGDFLAARRGVISDGEVLDLADALGMDAATLNRRQLGQAFNAEQVVAARKLLVQSATAVRDAMAKAADGSDAEVMAYAEAKQRHLMIQEQVSGITAEAGRALRAFRALEGSREAAQIGEFLEAATGRTLFQLRREAQLGMSLDTPQKVSKFMRDSQKASFSDMIFEYWVNGLISGPATHTTYMVGNALLALWKAVPEAAVTGAIGTVRRAFGATETVYGGEVGAGLYGLIGGVPDGLRAAAQAFRSGVTVALPGEDIVDFALQGRRPAIPDFNVAGVPIPLGTVARFPSRAVAVIHSFFRTIGYSWAKSALAYRNAAAEGLAGDEFARRVGELTTNPTPEMMAEARTQATEQTLMGKGGQFTQWLSMMSNKPILGLPLVKFIMPFVRIGSNIMSQGLLERTPLGILDPTIRDNLLGRNGTIARDTQMARIAVGTTLGAATIGLAAQGMITGGGPSDPKERALWMMTGKQPYSVRIGDSWYGIHRLGPIAMVMGVAADAYEFAHAMETQEADKLGGLLVTSITKGLLDETWMRGPAELIQALQDPDRYGAQYVREQLSTFLPYSVGMSQIARAIDPYSREARNLVDAFKAKISWVSETLLPRRDIFGEPIPNKDVLGVRGLSAIYETRVNNDPVVQAMLKVNYFPAQPERKIRGVQLTDKQYDDYSRIAGRTARMRLNAIVNSPGFSSIPDTIQREIMQKTIENAREAARSIVMMQNPIIITKAIEAKRAQLQTVH